MNLRKTRAQRRAIAREQMRLIAAAEASLERRLAKEISRAVHAAAANYPDWSRGMGQHREALFRILWSATSETGVTCASRARTSFKSDHLLPEVKLDTSEELNARVVKWAKKRAGTKVVDISKTTERRIRKVVTEGLDSGSSPAEIAREMADKVNGMTRARARTIARTEAHTAGMTGEYMAMEETVVDLGLEVNKVWVASEDDRTRDSHSAADGQTTGLNEPFLVGESELMYPGDPDGPPEEVINCRCTVVYEPA